MCTKIRKEGRGNVIQLKDILKETNITQLDIANKLGIRSLSTVNQKINNKSEFTVKEAILLRNLIQENTSRKYSIEELFDIDDKTLVQEIEEYQECEG